MSKFESSDSWIFLAIVCSSGGTLRDFYAVADYINVCIPTNEEIEGGVNRLAANSLIEVKSNSFSVTAKGLELFEKVKLLSRYPRPQVQLAVPLLLEAMKTEASEPLWRLDADIADQALKQYLKPALKTRKRRSSKD